MNFKNNTNELEIEDTNKQKELKIPSNIQNNSNMLMLS